MQQMCKLIVLIVMKKIIIYLNTNYIYICLSVCVCVCEREREREISNFSNLEYEGDMYFLVCLI